MEKENSNLKDYAQFYLIDHQEGGLLDWCKSEYLQIIKYLNSSNSLAVISNAATLYDFTDADEITRDRIIECNRELDENSKNQLIKVNEPLHKMITQQENDRFLTIADKKIRYEKVCLLDMRAESVLSPSDKNDFDVFIFGGILGDNPPRDRTSHLRAEGFKTRHLGDIQMSTDTAILTTKLIIENGIDITKIPFISEPEFYKDENNKGESVCMEGFKFISDEIDYNTGEIANNPNPKPLGNKTIYGKLIFEEFDPSLFI